MNPFKERQGGGGSSAIGSNSFTIRGVHLKKGVQRAKDDAEIGGTAVKDNDSGIIAGVLPLSKEYFRYRGGGGDGLVDSQNDKDEL